MRARRLWAGLGSAAFFVVAPGTVAFLLPWLITGWRLRPAFVGQEWLRHVGVAMALLGLLPLVESFARFAWQGLGTPAPVAPTERLVVAGCYRFVRNPMYVGVVLLVLGQALIFADLRLVWLAMALLAGFHLFVMLYEEPSLRNRFGAQYEAYCAATPRWLPRLRRSADR